MSREGASIIRDQQDMAGKSQRGHTKENTTKSTSLNESTEWWLSQAATYHHEIFLPGGWMSYFSIR